MGSYYSMVSCIVDQQTKDIAGQSANGLVSNRPMPMTTGCTENHQEFKKFNANAPMVGSPRCMNPPSLHSQCILEAPNCIPIAPRGRLLLPPGCKLGNRGLSGSGENSCSGPTVLPEPPPTLVPPKIHIMGQQPGLVCVFVYTCSQNNGTTTRPGVCVCVCVYL